MVVVAGRRPMCWACKQLSNFARSCPEKTIKHTPPTTAATSATSLSKLDLEPDDHPNKEEGWTYVIRKGRKPHPPQNRATATTTAEAAAEAAATTTTEAIAEETTTTEATTAKATAAVTSKPPALTESSPVKHKK